MPDGYPAIESYLNELADLLVDRLFTDAFESRSISRWDS